MTYCMDLQKVRFKIKRENKTKALDAIKAKARPAESIQGSNEWTYALSCESLNSALEQACWPPEEDREGNIDHIEFSGEKLHDDLELFQIIAPFVEDGSYLQMRGEDGDMWRWVFEDGRVREQQAKIIWED